VAAAGVACLGSAGTAHDGKVTPEEMRRDLGDGLVLRWSTRKDTEAVAELAGTVFRGKADGEPNVELADMVRRFMRGDYPFMGPEDFLLVEDTRRKGNPVVACTCYLQEEWELDGIPFPVGRPEIVATAVDYRGRGVVRAIFEELHERCARDGSPVQGITGIPYFYRQFGYEYALDLGGAVTLPVELLPPARTEGRSEPAPYVVRPARLSDLPALVACQRAAQRGCLVSTRVPESYWRYHIDAEGESGAVGESGRKGPRGHVRIRVIETPPGEFRGFFVLPYARSGDSLNVHSLELAEGAPLHTLVPWLLAELKRIGAELPADKPDQALRKIALELGRSHPVDAVLSPDWRPRRGTPYAWYLRVPDLPAFLRRVAPALERRLAASPLAGYDGEVAFDFYRGGLRMAFDKGRLQTAEHHRFEPYDNTSKGGFPPNVFLRLVFGYNSLDDLRAAYPDVGVRDEVELLVNTLFPKSVSRLFVL
jgi:Acetyltransferase (GNAT) domain